MPLFRSQTVAMDVHLLYWVLVQTTAWLSVGDAPELSKAVEVVQRRVGCFLSQHLLRRVRRAQRRSLQLKITLFAFSLCFPIKRLYLCPMRAQKSPPSFSVVRVRFGDADCVRSEGIPRPRGLILSSSVLSTLCVAHQHAVVIFGVLAWRLHQLGYMYIHSMVSLFEPFHS